MDIRYQTSDVTYYQNEHQNIDFWRDFVWDIYVILLNHLKPSIGRRADVPRPGWGGGPPGQPARLRILPSSHPAQPALRLQRRQEKPAEKIQGETPDVVHTDGKTRPLLSISRGGGGQRRILRRPEYPLEMRNDNNAMFLVFIMIINVS